MIINNYNIDLRKTFKVATIYSDLYNERQPNTSLKIKSTADKLLIYLFKQCRSQIDRDYQNYKNITIDTNESFVLYTNTTRIAKHLRISKNTVRNNIKRLINAGFIKSKTLHGRFKDYELHINPVFLFIYSVDNPKIRNFSHDFEIAVNQAFKNNETQILSQYILSQELLNNILITVSGVDKSNDVINESKTQEQQELIKDKINNLAKQIGTLQQLNKSKNFFPDLTSANTDKNFVTSKNKSSISISTGVPEQKKEKSSAKKEKKTGPEQQAKNFEQYKKQIAIWIVSYAIALLWKGRTIFASEFEQTVDYVYRIYLNSSTTYKRLDQRKAEFKWRLEAAHRYTQRKDFTISVYPRKYFDVNNKTSGFIQTRQWFLENLRYRIKKKKTNQKLSDEQKLNAAIRLYAKNPALSEFKKQEQYVLSNIPHLIDSFYQHFTNY